jgi:hypothetical protein
MAAEPMPLILDNAGVKISKDGTVPGLTELACLANHVEISPDVSETTLETFCGTRSYPGNVAWSLIVTLYQSFDPDATEEVLSGALAFGQAVPFDVVGRRSQAIGALNPAWSGMVIPQPYPPINGDAGEASTIDLEWSIVGAPTKRIVPTLSAAALEGAVTAPPPGAGVPDYGSMTLADLQAAASAAGLPTSGSKADLVARLTGGTA